MCANPLSSMLPPPVITPLVLRYNCETLDSFFTLAEDNSIQHIASGLKVNGNVAALANLGGTTPAPYTGSSLSPFGSTTISPFASTTASAYDGSIGGPLASSTSSPLASSVGNPLGSSVGSPVASSTASPLASSTGNPLASSVGVPLGSSAGSLFASSTASPILSRTSKLFASSIAGTNRNFPMKMRTFDAVHAGPGRDGGQVMNNKLASANGHATAHGITGYGGKLLGTGRLGNVMDGKLTPPVQPLHVTLSLPRHSQVHRATTLYHRRHFNNPISSKYKPSRPILARVVLNGSPERKNIVPPNPDNKLFLGENSALKFRNTSNPLAKQLVRRKEVFERGVVYGKPLAEPSKKRTLITDPKSYLQEINTGLCIGNAGKRLVLKPCQSVTSSVQFTGTSADFCLILITIESINISLSSSISLLQYYQCYQYDYSRVDKHQYHDDYHINIIITP